MNDATSPNMGSQLHHARLLSDCLVKKAFASRVPLHVLAATSRFTTCVLVVGCFFEAADKQGIRFESGAVHAAVTEHSRCFHSRSIAAISGEKDEAAARKPEDLPTRIVQPSAWERKLSVFGFTAPSAVIAMRM